MPRSSIQSGKTGGVWEPTDGPLFFIAMNEGLLSLVSGIDCVLIAVNELMRDTKLADLELLFERGVKVLLDSGAYSVAAEYARETNTPLEEALKIPLDQLPAFPPLLARYVELVKRYQNSLWGYIEVDLGGRAQKQKTRAQLEDMGFAPIPVYHLLTDPPEYFDELAGRYDRLAVGNMVAASPYVRVRMLATLAEKRQAYPGLKWIHALGVTPNETCLAYPTDSADSSAWLGAVKWSGYLERTSLRTLGYLPKNAQYVIGDAVTHAQGYRMGALGAMVNAMNWRQALGALGGMDGDQGGGVTLGGDGFVGALVPDAAER